MAIEAQEVYVASYEGGEPVTTSINSRNDVEVVIQGTLMAEGGEQVIELSAGQTATYQWMTPDLDRDHYNTQAIHSLDIYLVSNGEVIDTWKPFEYAFGTPPPYDNVPAIAKIEGTSQAAFGANGLKAMLLGEVFLGDPVPASSTPSLDFILRDPPGDQSSCNIVQGSKYSFEKELTTAQSDGQHYGQNWAAGLPFSLTGKQVLAPMGIGASRGANIEIAYENKFDSEQSMSNEEFEGLTLTETFETTETISTSDQPLSYFYGDNQDLFYGRTENVEVVVTSHFDFVPTTTALTIAGSKFNVLNLSGSVDGAPCSTDEATCINLDNDFLAGGDPNCDHLDDCIDVDGDGLCRNHIDPNTAAEPLAGIDLCDDPTACNYNAAANVACAYADAIGTCGGTCSEDVDGDGICDDADADNPDLCFDLAACNYDATSFPNEACTGNDLDEDGICDEIDECIDIDGDGLCENSINPISGLELDIIDNCADITACNYDATIRGNVGCIAIDAIGVCGGSSVADSDSDGLCDDSEDLCIDQTACNYDGVTYANQECVVLNGDFSDCDLATRTGHLQCPSSINRQPDYRTCRSAGLSWTSSQRTTMISPLSMTPQPANTPLHRAMGLRAMKPHPLLAATAIISRQESDTIRHRRTARRDSDVQNEVELRWRFV